MRTGRHREARFSFLADPVVAFAVRLSPQQKLDGVRPSPFLRDALGGTVPRKTERPAAAAPFGHRLQSEPRIKALAFDSRADLKRRGIVRAAFIDTLLTTRMAQNPAWHRRMVWLLMMLEQWFGQRRFRALDAPLMRKTADEPQACGQ